MSPTLQVPTCGTVLHNVPELQQDPPFLDFSSSLVNPVKIGKGQKHQRSWWTKDIFGRPSINRNFDKIYVVCRFFSLRQVQLVERGRKIIETCSPTTTHEAHGRAISAPPSSAACGRRMVRCIVLNVHDGTGRPKNFTHGQHESTRPTALRQATLWHYLIQLCRMQWGGII